MGQWVLDTSAIVVVIRGDRGADRVQAIYRDAIMSSLNAAEVLSYQTLRGIELARALEWFKGLAVQIEPFQGAQIAEVARLRPITRHLGLSLADRACLGLARLWRLPVMTTDRKWAQVNIGVEVELIH